MDSKTIGDIIKENPELKKAMEEHKAIPLKKLKSEEDPVNFVKIEIGYKSGTVAHVVNQEEYSIDAIHYILDKKTQKVKGEEGEFLGFEPTGEYVLTIKVKYTRPQ